MYAILSDIHGNMFAFEKVIKDMSNYDIEKIILLGDLIDYGMQSNEVIDFISNNWKDRIICNIWGNHEKAILTSDFNGFSSERGVVSAIHTASLLSADSINYLEKELIHEGKLEFMIKNKRVLAVHGSLDDNYWKAISADDLKGDYSFYDIVLSGHSHYSHYFTKFYDASSPDRRDKHAVIFINPGSVGQPRNHNPAAQYVLLDINSLSIMFRSVSYDIDSAMGLYDGSVDDFYRTRLKNGI